MKKSFVLLLTALAFASTFAQAPGGRNLLPRRGLRPGRQQAAMDQAAGGAASSSSSVSEIRADGSGLNFNGSVDELLFLYGSLVGKTILKDPQVKGDNIVFRTEEKQKLTTEEQIEAIEVVLEMNGVHVEAYGEKFVRALPRKEARKEGIPLILDPEAELKESVKVVSLMLPFKNITVEDAQKALDNFKSATGIIIGFERNNSLLLTDTEQNINRMREIAREIDIASPVTEVVEYIQIKNASAQEVKTVLDSIVQESQKELEKSGNTPANRSPAPSSQPSRIGGLLNRNRQQQQTAPASNESVLMTVSDADRGMIRGKVVTIADERSNKILIITSASNMKFFKEVIAALDVETTPDTVVKVYRLKYAEAEDVSDMINDLIGNSTSSKNSGKSNQNQNAKNGASGSATRGTQTTKKPANQRSGEVKAGELNKDNTTVLADKRINGLVVMTNKDLVPTIEQIIESMDIKLSQVLIETTIIEVTLGDGIETGMDWVQKGRQSVQIDHSTANGFLEDRYYAYNTDGSLSSTSYTQKEWDALDDETQSQWGGLSDVFQQVNQVVRGGAMNNWAGATSVGLGGGSSGGLEAYNALSGTASNLFGKAFSFIFDSDELGIKAILQASKNDSHSKYIASPIVMTLDNKEATVEATSSRQFLTGWQANSSGYTGSGMPSPTYSAKDIGIKLKVTPKINPNGTVMLEVEEEYSQVSGTQKMLSPVGSSYVERDIDVAVTRKMDSDVLMENGQTVVFGGLTEKMTSNSESGIPILKDIPYIGRWLFGSVKETETRIELLVFMTPYVLDDAQAAQAEALRRKKTMSDSRPWDDNGWSASNLADPVAKKEQMRRIKDEWKKQDEERRARLEIEKAKLDRAKKLKELSQEERDLWIKMHKEELEDDAQEELEKRMLDKDSQEELRKLADRIKADRLAAAEKEIKKAEEATKADNERAKLDAEKAKAEKGRE